MSNCVITFTIKDRIQLSLVQNAVLSISLCQVNGSRQTAFETTGKTDANGQVSFSVPQGAYLRFSSQDISDLNGWTHTAHRSDTFAAGVFFADSTNEVSAQDRSGAGAGAGIVTVQEFGDEACRKTVINLNSVAVTVGNTTGISFGGTKIYDFPEGRIIIHGATCKLIAFDLSSAGNVTPINGTMGGHVSVGTTPPSDGTLTGADVDIIPSTGIDPISGGLAGAALAAAAQFDGTGTAKDANFNILIDDSDVADGASDVIKVTGSVTIVWSLLGDF